MRINYQSDFKIIERNLNGDISTPFRFTYRTVLSDYVVAEFDGHGYKNCRRLDDGSLLVIFDNHGLHSGLLSVQREYYLSDADFVDGICNLVSVEPTGILLVVGKSDDSTAHVDVYPNYQKGDRGDPLTYDAMTTVQKMELKDAVVKDMQMTQVGSVALSENEYEDVLIDFVPPEPPAEEGDESKRVLN
ncbi:hypothetical protein [Phocaeicola sartorii]|uniref:hypothetical protein n=1 Tax=Phocaeicola sartorii TaxID=671267 RepID=UPI003511624F